MTWGVTKSLGEVATLQRGFDLPSHLRTPGSVQVISSSGRNGTHDQSPVSGPGVVTGRYGTIGEVFYVDEPYWPLNTTLWVKDFHDNDPKFVYYLLGQIDFKKFSDKTGVPGVNRNDLHKVKVVVPDILSQRAIAGLLTEVDQAIETTNKLLQAKTTLKSTLILSLLRSDNLQTVEYPLSRLVTFLRGSGLSKAAVNDSGANPCILYGELYTYYPEVIKDVRSRTNLSDGVKSVGGDLLIPSSTTTTGIDLANVTSLKLSGILIGGDINILRKKDIDYNSDFLAYYLTHIRKQELARLAQGSTIVHLYGSDLKGIVVKLPSLGRQEKVADILEDVSLEIVTLQKLLEGYVAQKNILARNLLTGNWRVQEKESAHA